MDILKNMLRSLIMTTLLVALPAYVYAQVPIEKELNIYRVNEVTGQQGEEERLAEIDSPVAGEIFEYELIYRNISGKNLDGIVIRQPILANLSYIHGSASAPENIDLYVSVDNGVTFQPEISVEFDQAAVDSDTFGFSDNSYSALQWVFHRPLAAGENLVLRYRVIAE